MPVFDVTATLPCKYHLSIHAETADEAESLVRENLVRFVAPDELDIDFNHPTDVVATEHDETQE